MKVKRSRGEALEQLRAEHDVRNQNQEANLDVVLDHMRQASNEEVGDDVTLDTVTSLRYHVLLPGAGSLSARGLRATEGHC